MSRHQVMERCPPRYLVNIVIWAALVGCIAYGVARYQLPIGATSKRYGSSDVAAINACFAAVARQLDSARNLRVTTAIPQIDQDIRVEPQGSSTDISVDARTTRGNKLLARSNCTVTRGAQIESLRTEVKEPVLLAGLKGREVSLALTR
jgi:hypothetical protein